MGFLEKMLFCVSIFLLCAVNGGKIKKKKKLGKEMGGEELEKKVKGILIFFF